jgi:hypothetical protein
MTRCDVSLLKSNTTASFYKGGILYAFASAGVPLRKPRYIPMRRCGQYSLLLPESQIFQCLLIQALTLTYWGWRTPMHWKQQNALLSLSSTFLGPQFTATSSPMKHWRSGIMRPYTSPKNYLESTLLFSFSINLLPPNHFVHHEYVWCLEQVEILMATVRFVELDGFRIVNTSWLPN